MKKTRLLEPFPQQGSMSARRLNGSSTSSRSCSRRHVAFASTSSKNSTRAKSSSSNPGGSLLLGLRNFIVSRTMMRRDRRVDQLAELVVLNEKLADWEQEQTENRWIDCRTKVEFLKTKKKNWEAVYDSISSHETEATLRDVESLETKLSDALSERNKESLSVSEAQDQLLALQVELKQAHERIHMNSARLKFLSERLEEIGNAETDCKEQCGIDEEEDATNAAAAAAAAAATTILGLDVDLLPVASEGDLTPEVRSLEMSPWYPVCLAETLQSKEDLVTFDLKGVPWVLFMNNEGEIGCIRDECSHRACPLSLGQVNEDTGCIECAYHGWQYDKDGNCTEMPSTNVRNTAQMDLDSMLVSKSKDGILWVTQQTGKLSGSAVLPPILTDLEQNDRLVEAFIDKIPLRAETVVDAFTIGGSTLAKGMYTRLVDFALKRPLTIGFELDEVSQPSLLDYELKFVSHYAFKICLNEQDTGRGVIMVFSFLPETDSTTNLIFQLYRKNKSRKGDRFAFPFKDYVMQQWEEHIKKEIRDTLMLNSEQRNVTKALFN